MTGSGVVGWGVFGCGRVAARGRVARRAVGRRRRAGRLHRHAKRAASATCRAMPAGRAARAGRQADGDVRPGRPSHGGRGRQEPTPARRLAAATVSSRQHAPAPAEGRGPSRSAPGAARPGRHVVRARSKLARNACVVRRRRRDGPGPARARSDARGRGRRGARRCLPADVAVSRRGRGLLLGPARLRRRRDGPVGAELLRPRLRRPRRGVRRASTIRGFAAVRRPSRCSARSPASIATRRRSKTSPMPCCTPGNRPSRWTTDCASCD